MAEDVVHRGGKSPIDSYPCQTLPVVVAGGEDGVAPLSPNQAQSTWAKRVSSLPSSGLPSQPDSLPPERTDSSFPPPHSGCRKGNGQSISSSHQRREPAVTTAAQKTIVWQIAPLPGYIESIIDSKETLGLSPLLPTCLSRTYLRLRTLRCYRRFRKVSTLLYVLGLCTLILTVENNPPPLAAASGVITTLTLWQFFLVSIPEFQTALLMRLLGQLDSWFYVAQSFPGAAILAYHFSSVTTGPMVSMKAAGMLTGMMMCSLLTVTTDALPQNTNTKLNVLFAAFGALIGIYTLLRYADIHLRSEVVMDSLLASRGIFSFSSLASVMTFMATVRAQYVEAS